MELGKNINSSINRTVRFSAANELICSVDNTNFKSIRCSIRRSISRSLIQTMRNSLSFPLWSSVNGPVWNLVGDSVRTPIDNSSRNLKHLK